jgi:hypothetical protein
VGAGLAAGGVGCPEAGAATGERIVPPLFVSNPQTFFPFHFLRRSPIIHYAQEKKPRYPGRDTAHLFDLTFKKLLRLSNKALISFINGLFRKKYPPDSTVEFLTTETVSKKLKHLLNDTRILINGDIYIIEAQIGFDGDMMVRVFEYAYFSGLSEKTFEDNVRTIEFPQAMVIYWEGKEEIPQKQVLRLKFPDGSWYNYEVETFEPLKHSVRTLEERGLAILLPFYILKLRKQVENAAAGLERKRLSGETLKLLDSLAEAVTHCETKGQIDEQDTVDILKDLERLYRE